MTKYYYMRGVAPKEAKEAITGKNGRVSLEEAMTNRGDEEDRLAFGMNEHGIPGIKDSLVQEFLIESCFYANLGAFVEAHPHLPDALKRNVHRSFRGYLLIFGTDLPLPLHKINLRYGKSWRTTSELPDGIEKKLIGVVPAPPMSNPSAAEEYLSKDFSLFKSNGTFRLEDIEKLNKQINTLDKYY